MCFDTRKSYYICYMYICIYTVTYNIYYIGDLIGFSFTLQKIRFFFPSQQYNTKKIQKEPRQEKRSKTHYNNVYKTIIYDLITIFILTYYNTNIVFINDYTYTYIYNTA